MQESKLPPITVVVPTNRAWEAVAPTVSSILASDCQEIEVLVVVQGPDWPGPPGWGSDHRVLVHPTPTQRGLSRARNAGIAQARHEFIACTDDDCLVARDWLARLLGPLVADPQIGLAFGSVLPGPHDPRAEFVLGYTPAHSVLARDLGDKHRVEGLGGCMGMRRALWLQLGGFDPMLGAGAVLEGGEEVDFTLRALLAGWKIVQIPQARVEHRGPRPRSLLNTQMARYMRGTGAAYGKLVRLAGLASLPHLLRLGWQFLRGRSGVQLRGPQRGLKLVGFLRGFWQGLLRQPLDRQTGHFRG